VGSKNLADKGLTIKPLSPDSFSIVIIACILCDIGLWPKTSPVITKEAPISSINSFAFLKVNILQSMQGFIFLPLGCFGFFTISIYSPVIFITLIGTSKSSATFVA
jgi:hypothetical protein